MNVDATGDPPADRGPSEPREPDGSDGPEDPPGAAERPLFLHPPWMVGVVLIFAVLAIAAGFENPLWWLIGSPCILVLLVYVWVRLTRRI